MGYKLLSRLQEQFGFNKNFINDTVTAAMCTEIRYLFTYVTRSDKTSLIAIKILSLSSLITLF